MRKHFKTKAITQLTAAGESEYLELGSPKSAEFEIVCDTSSSLIVRFLYSNDGGTTEHARSENITLVNGSLTHVLPIALDYETVAIEWVSGTATTVDGTLKTNILG